MSMEVRDAKCKGGPLVSNIKIGEKIAKNCTATSSTSNNEKQDTEKTANDSASIEPQPSTSGIPNTESEIRAMYLENVYRTMNNFGKEEIQKQEIKKPVAQYARPRNLGAVLNAIQIHCDNETEKPIIDPEVASRWLALQSAARLFNPNYMPGMPSHYYAPIMGRLHGGHTNTQTPMPPDLIYHPNLSSGHGISLENNKTEEKENIQPTLQQDRTSLLGSSQPIRNPYTSVENTPRAYCPNILNTSYLQNKSLANLPNLANHKTMDIRKPTFNDIFSLAAGSVSSPEMYPCHQCGEPNITMDCMRSSYIVGYNHPRLHYCIACYYDAMARRLLNPETIFLPPQDSVMRAINKILRIEYIMSLFCPKCKLFFDKKMYERGTVECQHCKVALLLQCSKCHRLYPEIYLDHHFKYECPIKKPSWFQS